MLPYKCVLPYKEAGEGGPLVVLLHWLGGSQRTWTEVSEALAGRGLRCVAVDLPGFGEAAGREDFDVGAMAGQVAATVRALRAGAPGRPWVLGGHSMGGKVAAAVARVAQDGAAGLEELSAMLLVSPSPPGPEPMKEKKRREMLESLGASTRDADEDRKRAEAFVDANVGKLPLAEGVCARAVEDVLRMNREALTAWLMGGSKEDWAERVGVLDVPALILTGSEEPELGPEVQRELTQPHFCGGEIAALVGGGHLGPLERPLEVADRMVAFLRQRGLEFSEPERSLGAVFGALIGSDRTSAQTRAVMLARLQPEGAGSGGLTADERLTLRALVRRVVPEAGFDLAARVEGWLAEPVHDGWRYDTLPPDAEAWPRGLRSLEIAALREHGVGFAGLPRERQDELLRWAREGRLGKGMAGSMGLGKGADAFDAAQMQSWFEDVRGELAKQYATDPRTMERMGFTGFADEGGFTQIELGQREEFEL